MGWGIRNMATLNRNWSKSEIRAMIGFLYANGKSPTIIHCEIVLDYAEDVCLIQPLIDK